MSDKEKILIADDSAMNRAILTEMLGDGYEILEAENGRQAVAILQSATDIDLLLLDIMMPGIDGMQVCKKIREKSNTIGIIMLSAKSQEMDKISCLMSGADDYITKPFSISELIARVAAVCRPRRTATCLCLIV